MVNQISLLLSSTLVAQNKNESITFRNTAVEAERVPPVQPGLLGLKVLRVFEVGQRLKPVRLAIRESQEVPEFKEARANRDCPVHGDPRESQVNGFFYFVGKSGVIFLM